MSKPFYLIFFFLFYSLSGTVTALESNSHLSPVTFFTGPVIEVDPETCGPLLFIPEKAVLRIKGKSKGFIRAGYETISGDWELAGDIPTPQETGVDGTWEITLQPDKNIFTFCRGDHDWVHRNIRIIRNDQAVEAKPFPEISVIDGDVDLRPGGICGLPLWMVRSEDPAEEAGVGKYTYLPQAGRFLRQAFNMRVMQLLPVGAAMPWDEHSPYVTSSFFALNDEWYIDWMDHETVPETWDFPKNMYYYPHSKPEIDYSEIRKKESIAAWHAFAKFRFEHQQADTERWKAFQSFVNDGLLLIDGHRLVNQDLASNILDYAQFRAFNEILGNDYQTWLREGVNCVNPLDHPEVRKQQSKYEEYLLFYQYKQWIAYQQWLRSVLTVNQEGSYIVTDILFGETEEGVTYWKHKDWFRPKSWGTIGAPAYPAKPGEEQEKDQDWGFLKRDWTKGFWPFISKFVHAVDILRSSGVRADAIHRIFPWVRWAMDQNIFHGNHDAGRYEETDPPPPGKSLLDALNHELDKRHVLKIAENSGSPRTMFDGMGFYDGMAWITYNLRVRAWDPPQVSGTHIVTPTTHDLPRPLALKRGAQNYVDYLKWQYLNPENRHSIPMIMWGDWERGERINDPKGDPKLQWRTRSRIPGDPGYNEGEAQWIIREMSECSWKRAAIFGVPWNDIATNRNPKPPMPDQRSNEQILMAG